MSPIPLRGRRDTTHTPIVQALRKAGYLVLPLKEFDMLVYDAWSGRLWMLDAKTGTAGPTVAQERLIQAGWPLLLVNSPERALEAIGHD